jgi:hypothetical protein
MCWIGWASAGRTIDRLGDCVRVIADRRRGGNTHEIKGSRPAGNALTFVFRFDSCPIQLIRESSVTSLEKSRSPRGVIGGNRIDSRRDGKRSAAWTVTRGRLGAA